MIKEGKGDVPGSRRIWFAVGLILILALVPASVWAARSSAPPGEAVAISVRPVCPGPAQAGTALCNSIVRTDKGGNGGNGGNGGHGKPTPTPTPTSTSSPTPTPTPQPTAPNGYGPSDLQSAYGLSPAVGSPGTGPTVAIVDAYDDPNAESDLNVYRQQFGLGSCPTSNGCFTKVNQDGVAGNYPRANGGWAEEISLDLDMVSAICPNCKILLVEANSNRFSDLATAVNTAANLPGVVAISNSYGGSEFSSETQMDETYFNHPGIAITASAGDAGYGVEYPAASQYVTAVGGTTLTTANNSRGWTETVWSGTGSGCSAYESKPGWQHDTGCANRTVADVAAVADPATGVAVYDSYKYMGQSGWLVFGGTSVSSPIIASVYALAGNTGSITYGSYPYSHISSLNDVTGGSNGSCGGSYLCTAKPGYDGPTGVGTPNGANGF